MGEYGLTVNYGPSEKVPQWAHKPVVNTQGKGSALEYGPVIAEDMAYIGVVNAMGGTFVLGDYFASENPALPHGLRELQFVFASANYAIRAAAECRTLAGYHSVEYHR